MRKKNFPPHFLRLLDAGWEKPGSGIRNIDHDIAEGRRDTEIDSYLSIEKRPPAMAGVWRGSDRSPFRRSISLCGTRYHLPKRKGINICRLKRSIKKI
jgi:hypothetical protein